jgi:hypothetical protein
VQTPGLASLEPRSPSIAGLSFVCSIRAFVCRKPSDYTRLYLSAKLIKLANRAIGVSRVLLGGAHRPPWSRFARAFVCHVPRHDSSPFVSQTRLQSCGSTRCTRARAKRHQGGLAPPPPTERSIHSQERTVGKARQTYNAEYVLLEGYARGKCEKYFKSLEDTVKEVDDHLISNFDETWFSIGDTGRIRGKRIVHSQNPRGKRHITHSAREEWLTMILRIASSWGAKPKAPPLSHGSLRSGLRMAFV